MKLLLNWPVFIILSLVGSYFYMTRLEVKSIVEEEVVIFTDKYTSITQENGETKYHYQTNKKIQLAFDEDQYNAWRANPPIANKYRLLLTTTTFKNRYSLL